MHRTRTLAAGIAMAVAAVLAGRAAPTNRPAGARSCRRGSARFSAANGKASRGSRIPRPPRLCGPAHTGMAGRAGQPCPAAGAYYLDAVRVEAGGR